MTKAELLVEKMNTLASLFGAKTGIKTSCRCRGKYAGTSDYFIKFNNGVEYFIKNGSKGFEEKLDEIIKTYSYFNLHKAEVLEILRRFETADSNTAARKGLNAYKIIDVDYVKKGDYLGWFYLKISVNGKIIDYIETNLYCAINTYCEYQGTIDFPSRYTYSDNYHVVGWLKEKDVDFVFHNVGHSTESFSDSISA